MLLKTYRAPDLATALAEARAELGPDALVLATSEVPGRLGLSGIEVTVGAARPALAPATGGDDAVRHLAREVERLRSRIDVSPAPPAPAAAPDAPKTMTVPALRAAVAALVASGLSDDLAERFARIASRALPAGGDPKGLAAAATKGVEALVPLAPIPVGGRCLFVVGPPGCGKTTTVAKLVARLAAPGQRHVFFGEADVDRIGSIEQAEIYSRHIGALLARVDDADDLVCALKDAGESGMVVVDTPGIARGDDIRLRAIEQLREAVPDAGVAVLLPAGLHRDEAARVLDRFAPLRPTCAGFSRVDDGLRVGELVTALAGSELPLSFVTCGHRVPQDLDTVSPRRLTALLLRAGRSEAEAHERRA
jgi:flagellar biosynthesis protein FlhF